MDWVTASVGREPVRALRTSWEPAQTGRRRASVDCGDVVSDLRVNGRDSCLRVRRVAR